MIYDIKRKLGFIKICYLSGEPFYFNQMFHGNPFYLFLYYRIRNENMIISKKNPFFESRDRNCVKCMFILCSEEKVYS